MEAMEEIPAYVIGFDGAWGSKLLMAEKQRDKTTSKYSMYFSRHPSCVKRKRNFLCIYIIYVIEAV